MRHGAAVIYELITALQLTTTLLYVFTYLSVEQHLTVVLSAMLLDCGSRAGFRHRVSVNAYQVVSAVMPHSILSHTTSTRASFGTSSREALPDWPAVLPAPFPVGQGCWQSRLARPHRWPEPGPPSSLRWLPPRQTTENRSEMGGGTEKTSEKGRERRIGHGGGRGAEGTQEDRGHRRC